MSEPPTIRWLDDGTPFADRYGDVYRSRDGGGQAAAVFVEGNDLPGRWRRGESTNVLETGFGLGLNCAAALHSFTEAAATSARLRYVAIELHPAPPDDLARAHAGGGPASSALVEVYPRLVAERAAHVEVAGRGVDVELIVGDGAKALATLAPPFDALLLDGFAPDRNPDLWSTEVFGELARLARPAATLATFTVARSVRDGLEAAGFDVERRPGFGSKRERLVGRRRE